MNRKNAKNPERSYEPDNILKKGFFRIFADIFSEIKNNRWLIFQLFKRDIISSYKQSFLGLFWAFFFPVLSIGTFLLLNRSGIFTFEYGTVPYAVFAISGMSVWQLFSSGIMASSNSLVKAGSMIVKINFSKKSLVIAATGHSLISFLVQLLLLVILLVYHGYTPHWSIVMLPVLVLPVFLLTMGLGLFFSILNGIARDTGNILSVSLTFFLFLTPVLYKKPSTGILSVISGYNPLHYLVSCPRDLILTGHSADLNGYMVSSLLSVIVFILFLFFFHVAETRVTERI